MSKRLCCILLIAFAVVLFSPAVWGQATGSFSGTVTDKSGSAVTGVTVTVTSQGTGAVREATTDEAGHYIVNLLPVSVYTVRAEFKGFQPVEMKDVKLQVDEQRELDFALSPASVSTSVEVVASEVAVETANPSLGQVITSQQVAQLPLNGRDFRATGNAHARNYAGNQPQQLFYQRREQRSGGSRFIFAVGGRIPREQHRLVAG